MIAIWGDYNCEPLQLGANDRECYTLTVHDERGGMMSCGETSRSPRVDRANVGDVAAAYQQQRGAC
jgi:hypothetical protein